MINSPVLKRGLFNIKWCSPEYLSLPAIESIPQPPLSSRTHVVSEAREVKQYFRLQRRSQATAEKARFHERRFDGGSSKPRTDLVFAVFDISSRMFLLTYQEQKQMRACIVSVQSYRLQKHNLNQTRVLVRRVLHTTSNLPLEM